MLSFFGGASVRFVRLTPAAQTMRREEVGRAGAGGFVCNADVIHDRPKGRRTLVPTGAIPVCGSLRDKGRGFHRGDFENVPMTVRYHSIIVILVMEIEAWAAFW